MSNLLNDIYQRHADKLAKYGIVNYPKGTEFTRSRRRTIDKYLNKFDYLLHHPEKFKVATVSHRTALELKRSGYQVGRHKDKAIIPKNGFSDVKIAKGKLTFSGDTKDGMTIKESVSLVNHKNFHKKLLSISRKKLAKNQLLTIKIGGNSSFNSRFQNYADLHHYLTTQFKPKGATVENLMRHISIVEVQTKTTDEKSKKGSSPTTAKKKNTYKQTKNRHR